MSCISILLTGAELAEFKSSANLQLFCSQEEEDTEESFIQEAVELRCKSGASVEFYSAVPFPAWSRETSVENPGAGKLRLGEGFSASKSPIVLKTRAVLEEEKQMKWGENPVKNRTHRGSSKKQRAFSMDENQLERMSQSTHHRRSITRDDLFSASGRRSSIKPLPLPLPLPPNEQPSSLEESRGRKQHRRHLSIDLRASPAAKFLVQLMPWEIPCESPERERSFSDSSLVPFKWEEAPGKPKSGLGVQASTTTTSTSGNSTTGFASGLKLRLPPRLQQQQQVCGSASKASSPTSTLDQRVAESGSSSTSSSPNEERMMNHMRMKKEQVKVRSRITALLQSCRVVEEEVEQPEPAAAAPAGARKMSTGNPVLRKRRTMKSGHPNSWGYTNGVSGSWSPSPRLTWLQRSGLEVQERILSSKNGAFGKLATGCNVVKRAMRCRWWVCRRKAGSKKHRKSMYKPLLCSVDGG